MIKKIKQNEILIIYYNLQFIKSFTTPTVFVFFYFSKILLPLLKKCKPNSLA